MRMPHENASLRKQWFVFMWENTTLRNNSMYLCANSQCLSYSCSQNLCKHWNVLAYIELVHVGDVQLVSWVCCSRPSKKMTTGQASGHLLPRIKIVDDVRVVNFVQMKIRNLQQYEKNWLHHLDDNFFLLMYRLLHWVPCGSPAIDW